MNAILTLLCAVMLANGMKAQHGFILAEGDSFASHLVATRHHSFQTSVSGELVIPDAGEFADYKKLRQSSKNSYFLLQAQNLDLTTLAVGDQLSGHIIQSDIGNYQPKNVVVKKAHFLVKEVHLKVENPFFQ